MGKLGKGVAIVVAVVFGGALLFVLVEEVIAYRLVGQCESLVGRSEEEAMTAFGAPRRLMGDGQFICPSGLRCKRGSWQGRVALWSFAADYWLIGYFGVDRKLAACEVTSS